MKRFRFDKEVGKHVTQFESDFWISQILRTEKAKLQLSFMHLDPGGVIGLHPTTVPQILLILQGEGIVSGGEEKMAVKTGEAIFWEAGEWHETRSEKGLMAIAIEGEEIDPEAFMKLRNY